MKAKAIHEILFTSVCIFLLVKMAMRFHIAIFVIIPLELLTLLTVLLFIKCQCKPFVNNHCFACLAIPHFFIQMAVFRLLQNCVQLPIFVSVHFFAQKDCLLRNPFPLKLRQYEYWRDSFVFSVFLSINNADRACFLLSREHTLLFMGWGFTI